MDTEAKPASPAATGWCPECSSPTISREGDELACKYGHKYTRRSEVHVPPSDGGDTMDDNDWAILQMERHEAANAPAPAAQTPAQRLQAVLDTIAAEYGDKPATGELTDEERAALKKKLGAVQENAEARVGMYTAPAKPLDDEA